MVEVRRAAQAESQGLAGISTGSGLESIIAAVA